MTNNPSTHLFSKLPPTYAVATLIYCAALFLLSSSPNPVPHEQFFPGEDKVAHAILYAVLAAIVSVGLQRAPAPTSARSRLLIPIAFVAAYGISDELHQYLVPGRSSDIWDVAADVCGGVLAQLALHNRLLRASARPDSRRADKPHTS